MFGFMDMGMTMFHGFWMFIFWIIFFYLIFSVFSKKEKHESPMDILKKRFARGEITKEEFETMKNILKKDK